MQAPFCIVETLFKYIYKILLGHIYLQTKWIEVKTRDDTRPHKNRPTI